MKNIKMRFEINDSLQLYGPFDEKQRTKRLYGITCLRIPFLHCVHTYIKRN